MIFKTHSYSIISKSKNEYGQMVETAETGKIRMFLSLNSQAQAEGPAYLTATYVGFTYENIDETYIIDNKYKVVRVAPARRGKVVYLADN